MRLTPRPLAILLALACLQGIVWATITPPLQGPDEAEHVAYTQYLAETGHGPSTAVKGGSTSTELGRIGYELNLLEMRGHTEGRPPWAVVGSVQRSVDALPDAARKDGSGPNAVAQNPPLYYAMQAVVYRLSPDRSILARITLMRLFNVALYVVAIGLVWMLATEVFVRTWLRMLTTAVVALDPKLASMAGYVNPDTLLVLISTWFLVVAIRLVRDGPTTRRVLLLAALTGAGAITHGRGLYLIGPALVTLAISLARARPGILRSARLGAIGVAVFAIPFVAATLWTRAEAGGGAFGGEITQATATGFSARQFASYVWQFFLPRLSFMQPMLGPPYGYRQTFIETFFGGWGNYEVNFTPSTYDLLQVAVYLGLLAVVVLTVVRWPAVRAQWPTIVVIGTTVGALVSLLMISTYRHLQGGGAPLITGRYLLSCIAVFGIVIAWVAGSLPRRASAVFAGIVIAGSVLLNAKGLLLTIERFYG